MPSVLKIVPIMPHVPIDKQLTQIEVRDKVNKRMVSGLVNGVRNQAGSSDCF